MRRANIEMPLIIDWFQYRMRLVNIDMPFVVDWVFFGFFGLVVLLTALCQSSTVSQFFHSWFGDFCFGTGIEEFLMWDLVR